MKKSFWAISILIFIPCFYSCSQKGVDTYNNKLNKKYIDIPGTRLSIIPPVNFKLKNQVPQLTEVNGNAQIGFYDLPESYFKIISMYSVEAYKNVPGENLKSTRKIFINGYEGTELIILASTQKKYLLIFGNDKLCIFIGGTYLTEYESNLADKIKECVLSVVFDPKKELDPEKNLPYQISTSDTKLKLGGVYQSGSFYNVTGNESQQVYDKTELYIQFAYKSLTEDEIQQFIKDVMNYEGKFGLEIGNSTKVIIDGLSGYETIGYVKVKNDTIKLIYYVILFDANEIYSITGRSNIDFTENINLFRKILKTFKRK